LSNRSWGLCTIESILFGHPLITVQRHSHGSLGLALFVHGELGTCAMGRLVTKTQPPSPSTPPASFASTASRNSGESSCSHSLHPTQHAPPVGPPHSSRAYSFSENPIRPGYEQRKQSCTGEKPDSRCHQGIVWHVLRLSVAGGQRRL